MSIADELTKLDELRKSGAITHEEFAQAKAALLNAPESSERSTDPRNAHLEQIKHQNEIAEIDRAWAMEREQYLVRDRWGRAHVPQKGGAEMLGMMRKFTGGGSWGVVIFGVIWFGIAFFITQNAPFPLVKYGFPLMGVLIVLFGLAASRGMSSMMEHSQKIYEEKAIQYQQAYEDYQRRREEAVRRHRS